MSDIVLVEGNNELSMRLTIIPPVPPPINVTVGNFFYYAENAFAASFGLFNGGIMRHGHQVLYIGYNVINNGSEPIVISSKMVIENGTAQVLSQPADQHRQLIHQPFLAQKGATKLYFPWRPSFGHYTATAEISINGSLIAQQTIGFNVDYA